MTISAGYRVKTLMLASGERLPVLVDGAGQPLFDPTIFALTQVRGKALASNTIGIVLRSVMAFHLFLDARGIDLDARLATGEILSLGEVEDLARLCRRHLNELPALLGEKPDVTPKVISLEKARMSAAPPASKEMDPEVAASRLRYIRMYLEWLALERQSRHSLAYPVAERLGNSSKQVIDAINARLPKRSGRDALDQREGLPEDVQDEFLRVIDPRCKDNPWREQHARYRNALLMHWWLYLGVRLGEVLGVRVNDLALYHKEVTIHRRADDQEDPRRYQPQTKTRARVLALSETLLAETQAYILNHRSAVKGARKHPFLFVASRTGAPLSTSAVGKLFRVLRKNCPWLPETLTAHVLRHTWNDTFSKEMEENGVPPEIEQQTRSELMGWNPNSGTAATYTRRYTRNKAKEVSLRLQEKLVNRGREDE